MEGWRPGPTADKGARWTPAEAGEAAAKLLAAARATGAGVRGVLTHRFDAPGYASVRARTLTARIRRAAARS